MIRLTNPQRRELRMDRRAIHQTIERHPEPYTICWEPQDSVALMHLRHDIMVINSKLAFANGDDYTREVNVRWAQLAKRLFSAKRRLQEKRASAARAKLGAARYAWWLERNQNLPKFATALERVDIEFGGKVPEGCPF